jgi:hypothetical protein
MVESKNPFYVIVSIEMILQPMNMAAPSLGGVVLDGKREKTRSRRIQVVS